MYRIITEISNIPLHYSIISTIFKYGQCVRTFPINDWWEITFGNRNKK